MEHLSPSFFPFGCFSLVIWFSSRVSFPGFWGGLIVTHLLSGPTGEEAGWRGFALPRLLEKYSPLSAAIILGIIWDFWHLPLWIIGGSTLLYCLFFSIGIISLSVLMTWIFRRTPTSLVPEIIIHFSYNVGLYLIGPQGMGLGPIFPLTAIMATLCLLTAIVIYVAGGLRSGLDHPISRQIICCPKRRLALFTPATLLSYRWTIPIQMKYKT